MALLNTSTSRALPPWLLSPEELAVATANGVPRGVPGWLHALAPYLMGAAFLTGVVTWVARAHDGATLIAPCAAIAVTCAALPLARATRRTLQARSVDAMYRTLQWLAPWVTLAWAVIPSGDRDGGNGGALGVSMLLGSVVVLPFMVPILAWSGWIASGLSSDEVRLRAPRVSFALIACMVLSACAFTISHPTQAFLWRIPSEEHFWPSPPEHLLVQGGLVTRAQVANRCVTYFGSTRSVTPTCPPTVRVWRHRLPYSRSDTTVDALAPKTALFDRPPAEYELVELGGAIYGPNGIPARYFLYASPLWEWWVGAALGLAMAAWTLRRSRRTLLAWRALRARGGRAREGCAYLDDGTVIRLSEALARHTGDVVVLDEGEGLGVVFRGTSIADGMAVLPISGLAWERALSDSEQIAASFARALLWLSASPLMASPFLGMFAPWP